MEFGGSVVKHTFIREKSLTRRDCVFKSVRLFVYSQEEQAAARRTRQKRERATLPKVKSMNDRYSRELFEWLVQNNFTRNDYFITLTFSGKVSEQDGKRLFGNYIRRLRRLYHSKSAALKYIYVEEFGETSGLYHVHLLIDSAGDIISEKEITHLWKKKGICDIEYLHFTAEGLSVLCRYLMKSQKSNPKYKRLWNCSQSCTRPEVVTDDNRISRITMRKLQNAARNDELVSAIERIYTGWRVLSAPEIGVNDVTGREYMRVRLMRKSSG